MDVQITFKLLEDKSIKLVNGQSVSVAGLAEYHVCPEREGFGRRVLGMLGSLTAKPIVGFAEDENVEFYRKCGWHVIDTRDEMYGKYIISNVALPVKFSVEGPW